MGEMLWYCSGCGDGPIAVWQNVCVVCSHQKCGSCTVEDTEQSVPVDDSLSSRSIPNAGGMKGSIPEATGDEEEYGSDVKTNPVTHDEDDRDVALGQVSDSGPVLHSQGVYLSTSPPDDEDNMSTTSTTLGSVFSTDSLATSITAFSKESGFSIEQIQTATRVFVSIVQDNELLAPLYEYARNDVEIGPNRLRRHIRGALKTFADNLKEKADDHIQFQASRLVHAKARHAARCIASGEDQNHQPQANSSEDEIAERAVEEAFLDLKAFRIFLTESDAYAIFQADIHAFCTKQSTRIQNLPAIDTPKPLPVPKDSTKRTWYSWKKDTEVLARGLLLGFDRSLGAKAAMFLLLDFFFLLTDDSLVALGWLEPALRVGWTRLRSQCNCGDYFFEDVIEQRVEGVTSLLQDVRQSLPNIKTTVVPYQSGFDVQQYTITVSTWLRHVSSRVFTAVSGHNGNHTGLPQHNTGSAVNPSGLGNIGSPQQQHGSLHLMACVHRSREDTVLLQNDVRTISNDRALFTFLRSQISQRRNRLLLVLSCRSIKGIYFSKFRLSNKSSVEIRHHHPCCQPIISQAGMCQCFPPFEKIEPFPNAEYRCTLPYPLDAWPPVLPRTLLHMLKCPNKINEKSTWIYNLAPKRTVGELSSDIDQPTDGWGFYFEEGWDFDLIITISFVVFILGSLLFGICWSVLEHDIQGAFGVSAYMVTACGLFVAFVVSKTG